MSMPAALGTIGERYLTIVIPALNEELAIGGTIRRCIEAIPSIRARGGVSQVEIVVVSDGSTDDTARIARSFETVKVLEFPKNRGYGAAIKAGIGVAAGELVGFLDADGTCDPAFFGDLCRAIGSERAEIALGSRLSRESRMPAIRTLGNRMYALLLSILSNRTVTDTASGMRVLKRSALEQLGPLPDGLHYTPAMSARAVLSGMTVAEIPMSYAERVGESKLRVSRDGWRFLQAIVDGVFLFRPERLFVMLAVTAVLGATVLSLHPIEMYLTERRIDEWMIYRFVVAFLLGAAGAFALFATAIVSRVSMFVLPRAQRTFLSSLLLGCLTGWRVVGGVTLLSLASLALVAPGLVEYARTSHVTMHWSRVMVAAFGLLVAFQSALAAMLLRTTTLWLEFAVSREAIRAGKEHL